MTKEFKENLRKILTNTEFIVDPLKTTAVDVFNKLLSCIEPLCNTYNTNLKGILSDNLIEAYLASYDYKSPHFAKQTSFFCEVLQTLVTDGHTVLNLSDDVALVYVSIILYIQNTDIETERINILFNKVMNQLESESISMAQDMSYIYKLFDANATGLKQLELDTSTATMDVISAVRDFLGSDRNGTPFTPEQTGQCATHHMMTPTELGIDVNKFLSVNRRMVQRDTSITLNDVLMLVNELRIDTNRMSADQFLTVYDLINIRFCTWFYVILHWILSNPDHLKGLDLLNKVIHHLLKTDKEFIGLRYSYLTLVEIALNCLQAVVQRQDYYNFIRAKNLKYCEMGTFEVDHLNQIYTEVHKLQETILQDTVNEWKKVDPRMQKLSTMESLLYANTSVDARNTNQGNCMEGTTILQIGIDDNISAMQYFELQDMVDKSESLANSDIKKLLGESFELSTMLEAELQKIRQSPWFRLLQS